MRGGGLKVLLSPSPPHLPLDVCSVSEASCTLSTHTLASLTSPFEPPPAPNQELTGSLVLRRVGSFQRIVYTKRLYSLDKSRGEARKTPGNEGLGRRN